MTLEASSTFKDSNTGSLSKCPKYAIYPCFLASKTCLKSSEIITKGIFLSFKSFAITLPKIEKPQITI